MRISEGLQLRVGSRFRITARSSCGQGLQDRALMLPESLAQPARAAVVRAWWLKDQAEGRSGVALPDALEWKYPRAGHSWPWFWVFAQHTHSTDPRSGVVRRHHMYDQTFQRLQTCRRTSRHHEARHTAHPPPLVRDGLAPAAVTTFEPCRICSAIPTSLRR